MKSPLLEIISKNNTKLMDVSNFPYSVLMLLNDNTRRHMSWVKAKEPSFCSVLLIMIFVVVVVDGFFVVGVVDGVVDGFVVFVEWLCCGCSGCGCGCWCG